MKKNKETMPTMTQYINRLSLEQMEYLDLFDDIPYKYVKDLVKMDNETDFEVEIEDIYCDRVAWFETKITFTININDIDKTFEKVLYYNNSSPIALAIMELEDNESSGEDNEESSESGETSDESSEDEDNEIEDNLLSRAQ
jgi:hypothetical protein